MSSSEATGGGVGGCRSGEGEVGWGWGGALEARRGRTKGERGDPVSKGRVAPAAEAGVGWVGGAAARGYHTGTRGGGCGNFSCGGGQDGRGPSGGAVCTLMGKCILSCEGRPCSTCHPPASNCTPNAVPQLYPDEQRCVLEKAT